MTSPPKDIDAESTALFLDVDGTLLDIQDDPAAVRANATLIELLVKLEQRLDGALSLISGRSVADIDRVFAPAKFPAAGAHGVELRIRDGEDARQAGMRLPDGLFEKAEDFVSERPGLLVERKHAGLALHYRRAPELESVCRDFIAELMRGLGDDFRLIDGKMVLELAPRDHHKGEAIREMLQHEPFAGRRPIFVGDDVTDEDGFHVVNELGGVSIRVGAGTATAARCALGTVSDVHDWLHAAAAN